MHVRLLRVLSMLLYGHVVSVICSQAQIEALP